MMSPVIHHVFFVTQSQQQKDKSEPGDHELKCIPVDPAVDLMFQRFKREMDASKSKVEEMQNELSAWKFTPDRY